MAAVSVAYDVGSRDERAIAQLAEDLTIEFDGKQDRKSTRLNSSHT